MPTEANGPRPTTILALNPNSSTEMTTGMAAAIAELNLGDSIKVITYTAPPSSPASINDADDINTSYESVTQDIESGKLDISHYDAVLIACFSVHTLVPKLPHPCVTGIFEASILTAHALLHPYTSEKWGIITTGKFWEAHLEGGVKAYLGEDSSFAGVFSTGLTAGDFHKVSPEVVREKLKDATQRLLDVGDVTVAVMGCAGMAGLEGIIRETVGDRRFYVVDGVKAGVLQLENMKHSRDIFA